MVHSNCYSIIYLEIMVKYVENNVETTSKYEILRMSHTKEC
jgi:hypothetical protein